MMKSNHTTQTKARAILFVLLIVAALIAAVVLGSGAAEDHPAKCWIMCKPGSQVNVRRRPSENSLAVGFLDSCDWFLTDGESRNGFIHCLDVGENCGGWIYAGYVVTEEPRRVGERFVCVAKNRAACRRWIGGPRIDGRAGWISNGQNCDVFLIADGWACTSRGYIKAEWLEPDPE